MPLGAARALGSAASTVAARRVKATMMKTWGDADSDSSSLMQHLYSDRMYDDSPAGYQPAGLILQRVILHRLDTSATLFQVGRVVTSEYVNLCACLLPSPSPRRPKPGVHGRTIYIVLLQVSSTTELGPSFRLICEVGKSIGASYCCGDLPAVVPISHTD
jgi:hypothetical protein